MRWWFAATLLLLLGCDAEDRVMGDGLRGTPDDPAHYSVIHQAAQVCADGPTLYGIDVSKWQGDINWAGVANSDVRYAVIRVSSGLNTIDEKFARNWAGARDVGLPRGAYQYFRPAQDALAQAELFVRRIREEGGGMELPAVIDVEEDDGQSAQVIAQKVRIWIDHVERELGVPAMIYTGRYFWQDHVANNASFSDTLLWHPQYTSAQCPNISEPWEDWVFWQFSSTGRVNGINGDVDENRFNGDEAALLGLIGGGEIPLRYGGRPRGQSFPLASEAPIELCVGETLEGFIRVENISTAPWDDQVRLAPTPRDVPSAIAAPSWMSPVRVTPPSGIVQPGEEGRFEFTIQGNQPGLVDQTFGLVAEGVTWFADDGGPADDYMELVVNVRQCEVPVDAGPPVDARPPVDAGPPVDMGPDAHPPVDAGLPADVSLPVDARPPVDAARPPVDAARPPVDAARPAQPDAVRDMGPAKDAAEATWTDGGDPIAGEEASAACGVAPGSQAGAWVVLLGLLLHRRRR